VRHLRANLVELQCRQQANHGLGHALANLHQGPVLGELGAWQAQGCGRTGSSCEIFYFAHYLFSGGVHFKSPGPLSGIALRQVLARVGAGRCEAAQGQVAALFDQRLDLTQDGVMVVLGFKAGHVLAGQCRQALGKVQHPFFDLCR